MKIGAILLLLIIYQLNIKQTIRLGNEVIEKRKYAHETAENSLEYYSLKEKFKELDTLIKAPQNDTLNNKNKLAIISDLAAKEKVKVLSIPMISSDTLNFALSKTELQGEFIPLLRFLNKYEKETKKGAISSVSFLKPQTFNFNDKNKEALKLICM